MSLGRPDIGPSSVCQRSVSCFHCIGSSTLAHGRVARQGLGFRVQGLGFRVFFLKCNGLSLAQTPCPMRAHTTGVQLYTHPKGISQPGAARFAKRTSSQTAVSSANTQNTPSMYIESWGRRAALQPPPPRRQGWGRRQQQSHPSQKADMVQSSVIEGYKHLIERGKVICTALFKLTIGSKDTTQCRVWCHVDGKLSMAHSCTDPLEGATTLALIARLSEASGPTWMKNCVWLTAVLRIILWKGLRPMH